MNIEDIRLFTEVVAHQGISRAARRNNLSQQTLSRRMIVLEQEVGQRLFDRGGDRVDLTPSGRVFLNYAHEVLSLTQDMRARIKEASRLKQGIVRVKRYATASFFRILSQTIELAHEHNPGIEFEMVSRNDPDEQMVRTGKIDLGFMRTILLDAEEPPQPDADLRYIPLGSNSFPLTFGVAQGHPLLQLQAPTLADIARYQIATPSFASNGPIPMATAALFARHGLTLRVDMVVSQSMLEYYAFAQPESIYVFNEMYTVDSMSSARRRYVALQPADGPYLVTASAVYDPRNANPVLGEVLEHLTDVDAMLAAGE